MILSKFETMDTDFRVGVWSADAFFPAIDPSVWTLESETPAETDPETGYSYTFAVYIRK